MIGDSWQLAGLLTASTARPPGSLVQGADSGPPTAIGMAIQAWLHGVLSLQSFKLCTLLHWTSYSFSL